MAMSFDGVDDYIELQNSTSLNINSNQITLIVKVKPDLKSSTGTYEIL